MKDHPKKGFKPLFIKYLALIIGICYLANPLHHQIGVVFHEVAYLFVMPNSVMSHAPIQKQEELFHYTSEHIYSQEENQHQLVGLLNSIFEAEDESADPRDDTLLTHMKFDKHLTNEQYTFQMKDMTRHHSNPSLQLVKKVKVGNCEVLDEPPQYYIV